MYDAWDVCETMRKGDEVRFTYPPPDKPNPYMDEIKVTHLPTTCREIYDDGTGRWQECMGVGPK